MRVSLHKRGFSLIELMIVVAIIAILSLLAMPSFIGWIANSRTRTVADSIENGLRYAQTEAIRLSRLTTFVLTPATNSWAVDWTAVTGDATAQPHPLQISPAGNLTGPAIAIAPAGEAVIQFNSLGRPLAAATAAGPFTAMTADATFTVTNSPNGTRRSQVVVSAAGKIRTCDPDKVFGDTTPDGC